MSVYEHQEFLSEAFFRQLGFVDTITEGEGNQKKTREIVSPDALEDFFFECAEGERGTVYVAVREESNREFDGKEGPADIAFVYDTQGEQDMLYVVLGSVLTEEASSNIAGSEILARQDAFAKAYGVTREITRRFIGTLRTTAESAPFEGVESRLLAARGVSTEDDRFVHKVTAAYQSAVKYLQAISED